MDSRGWELIAFFNVPYSVHLPRRRKGGKSVACGLLVARVSRAKGGFDEKAYRRRPGISVVAVVGVATAGGSPPNDLRAAKGATARYHSFQQALKNGYSVEGESCVPPVPLPLPAMGIHAVNEALMADAPNRSTAARDSPLHTGQARQAAARGARVLEGDADQNLLTSGDRPSVFGHPFDGPMPGHNPTMPVHYDLHVQLWEDNPSGLFAEFNPNLRCPAP
jgi:hypothetical protein